IYEDIGTELQFLPIVYGDGKIYLEVAPTIRSVNQALGIVTTFGAVPGFDEQSVRTSVVMEDGQTFAIGGLIQSQVQASSTRVPFLGDVPFVGAAFRTNSQTETEQELVILVTPHLVDPMDCHQVSTKLPGRETRSPSDFELFLEGLMEAPRGQREIFEGGRYKAAYKNHPSYQQYPCNVLGGVNGHGDGACAPAAGHTVPANLPFPAGGAAFPPAAPAGAGTGAAPGLPGELPPAGEPLPPAAGGEAGLAFPDGPPVMPAGTRSIP
ncbi:MAG TPA: type II and III secretion system protein, partial [Gemmataceae bacterium]